MDYSKRLTLLHALCLADTYNEGAKPNINLDDYKAIDSAHYLTSFITFKAIQAAMRQPADERHNNFDMLSVYQAYAMLIFAFLTLPLSHELSEKNEAAPDLTAAQVIIARTFHFSSSMCVK